MPRTPVRRKSDSRITRSAFEMAVVDAVHAVRDAFARIIETKCPGPKAVSNLCEAFGVHRKLAWQLTKVAYSADPFTAARHVPSGKSMTAWLEASERVGVPPALIASAREALTGFEALTAAHAATRAELEMLLESCAERGGAPELETHAKWREQAFRGNAFIWGAHCRVLMAMMVLQPSEDIKGHFHCCQVRGIVGYRQTRAGVRWVVNQGVVADEKANTRSGVRRVPLDPDAARGNAGVPVLPRFCSTPTPRLTRRELSGGIVLDEFVSGEIGQKGERTLVTGEVARNIGAAYQTERDKFAHFGTGVRIPAELLHFDLFVHRTLFAGASRDAVLRVFSDLASPAASDDADALPVPEKISPMGRGVTLAHSPDVPGYTDMALWVFQALGAEAGEYDLLRVRMVYPPMPVSVMVKLRLPPAPGGDL